MPQDKGDFMSAHCPG